jgi:signal transduction histidine kinase
MRRSVWIFLASIFLPSLGLAWLAVRSVQDQQVVLEHQQVIISQNITDALAKNIQGRMDQVRGDFVNATQQLLSENSSPRILAQNFNRKLRDAWPLAEIGFAVDLNGEIYSPKPYDGPDARTFRDENDRFLSNRENVEVYSSNSLVANQNASGGQNAVAQFAMKLPEQTAKAAAEKTNLQAESSFDSLEASKDKSALSEPSKNETRSSNLEAAIAGRMTQVPPASQNAEASSETDLTAGSIHTETAATPPASDHPMSDMAKRSSAPVTSTVTVTSTPAAPATAPTALPGGGAETISAPTTTIPGTTLSSSSTATGMINNANLSFAKIQRQVIPQQMPTRETASLSSTVPEESDFRRVIGAETSGELARFLENKMRLMVWSHPLADTPIVFGAQLDQGKLVEALKASFQIPALAQDNDSRSGRSGICAAILDDTGHPVALSQPGFKGDWKHPFVATEIGEVLPHWEAALYLVDPQQIGRAARTLQFTLGLIVLLLVAAIVSGGSLIAADVRRQVRLAQQKTDFVSNVSHELKTPLTSIRMFADLLAEKRVPDEERQATYLRIIAAEAARLTRLINNVLDFARLEQGAPPGEHRACDLVEAVRDVVETCGPHLEAAGIAFRHEIEVETLPIRGDQDALAQIILNLVSNAEKYGGNDVLVRVRRQETPAGALGCVDVLDRGPGIPARQEKTVFEPFHRLDDSLSSGIPGSGLGLTLARRMARAHGGDVAYSPRAGGGSCFTLTVPLGAAA